MPRAVYTPVRRNELIDLAAHYRNRFEGRTIDEVAELENIILFRLPDKKAKMGGFAYVEREQRPKTIPSLSRPGEKVVVPGEYEEHHLHIMVLNPAYPIPEREVFWHEWYHLFFSPNGGFEAQPRGYSMECVLYDQEERRANEFAALFLIPEYNAADTIPTLTERYGVSEFLAKIALEFYSKLGIVHYPR